MSSSVPQDPLPSASPSPIPSLVQWWWGGDYAAFNTRMQIQTALLQLCYGFQWNTGNRHAVM